MANGEKVHVDKTPITPLQPSYEDVAALLDILGDPPPDEAEERAIRVFKMRLEMGKKGCCRRDRRLPNRQFRPYLEDLGPREMSSFPFSVNALAAGMAGPASVAIVAADRLPAAVASPLAGLSAPAGQHLADTGAVDFFFSNCQSSTWAESRDVGLPRLVASLPEELLAAGSHLRSEPAAATSGEQLPAASVNILPELGAILLLGGLRQDRDQTQARRPVYSRKIGAPGRRVACHAGQPELALASV